MNVISYDTIGRGINSYVLFDIFGLTGLTEQAGGELGGQGRCGGLRYLGRWINRYVIFDRFDLTKSM